MELQLPPLHAGQQLIVDRNARFSVVACGRRWGKTRLGTLLCLMKASKGQRCWWVAPSYKVAMEGFRTLRFLASQIPRTKISESEMTITCNFVSPPGEIAIRSAESGDSLRGAGLDMLVLDEAAYLPSELWFSILRPALVDREGSCLFISSPNGLNYFSELYEYAELGEDPEWAAFRFPTSSSPFISKKEIEAAKRSMPELRFRQEFMAEFVQDSGLVFHRVKQAIGAVPHSFAEENHEYVIGVDWGRSDDFTVITVIDITTMQVVYIERFNQIDYLVQIEKVVTVSKRFNPRVIVAEANQSRAILELLRDRDLPIQPFTMTQPIKNVWVDKLAVALEQEKLLLLNDPELVKELMAFSIKKTPSGNITYGAPSGYHDDCVMSLILAWSAVLTGGSDWSPVLERHDLEVSKETNPWLMTSFDPTTMKIEALKQYGLGQGGQMSNRPTMPSPILVHRSTTPQDLSKTP